ncbi:hypothetical protein GCM10010289_27280 [Streptomyces violascens]|uniref:Uncharacterized protein n=1 Tax=Streptomyces violascens TaxID=67381 RepID=A0ABQ3QHI0_9ACTN|nr:hypothetical protein GCM10010289_27280 [Streptomyces violascens]GHI36746.1 hypothetical protein Sviol_11540 [Streptomyces violascens]
MGFGASDVGFVVFVMRQNLIALRRTGYGCFASEKTERAPGTHGGGPGRPLGPQAEPGAAGIHPGRDGVTGRTGIQCPATDRHATGKSKYVSGKVSG